MALKYPADFKIKAVKEYLKYERGLLSIARDLGIYSSDLHKWVRLYHYHGEEAFIEGQRGRVYSPEFRQMVLDTMRRESLSVVETTARFKLSSNGLIKRWKKQYHEQVNNVHENSNKLRVAAAK